MAPELVVTSESQFGQYLMDKMKTEGVSIRELSAKAEITYEYVRKLVRGQALPSVHMLRILCDVLNMNRHEAKRLVVADRIRKDYGTIPIELAGKNPDAEFFDRNISRLSAEQRRYLETQLKMLLRKNQKDKRH